MWENEVGDLLNVRNICKSCAEYNNTYEIAVLKVRKNCNSCDTE